MTDNYTPIAVTDSAFAEIKLRKLQKQAKLGKELTWDEFLLGAVKAGLV